MSARQESKAGEGVLVPSIGTGDTGPGYVLDDNLSVGELLKALVSC